MNLPRYPLRLSSLSAFILLYLILLPCLLAIPLPARAGGILANGVTADTVLTTANSPYRVTTFITVGNGATLTIQPGVVVQFQLGTYLEIDDGSQLIAEGTAAAPIRFTSAQAQPDPGDWRGFYFHPQSQSTLAYCDIGYAGTDGAPALDNTATNLSVQNSQIHDSAGPGIHLSNNGIAPTFIGVTIANSAGPAIAEDSPDFGTNYQNLTLSGNHPDGVVMGSGGIDKDTTFTLVGYPYYVTGTFETLYTSTMTFAPGTEFRFMPGTFLEISDFTHLVAEGTAQQPIRFTSAQAQPAPGDWRGFFLHAETTVNLSYCDFGYGGGESQPTIVVTSSQTALHHCTVHDGANAGIRFDVTGFQPTVDTVTVANCDGPALLYTGVEVQPIFTDLVLNGNQPDGISVATGAISPSMAWDLVGYPYYLQGPIDVLAPATLTIAPGSELRFVPGAYLEINDDAQLVANGTQALPIRYTAATDPPNPGDWLGFVFHTRSQASMAYSDIGYAGDAGDQGVYIMGPNVTLQNCALHDGAGSGIHVGSEGSSPTFQNLTIRNNAGPAIALDNPDMPITFGPMTMSGNHPDGVAMGGGGVDRSFTFELVGYPYYVQGTIGVTNGATLTIAPGAVLRFGSGTYLEVYDGTQLVADGVPGQPITLTSAAAVPQPGDWRGIYLHALAGLDLADSEIAYGGSGGEPAIDDNSSQPVRIQSDWIHDCAGPALRVNNAANPTINGNRIEYDAAGLVNLTPSTPVTATNNWWGDPNGPQNPANPLPTQGESVSDGVVFQPWITQQDAAGIPPGPPSTSGGTDPLPGDVNGDGKVNIQDVIDLLQIIAGLQPASPNALAAGDLNGDGTLDIQDAVLLLRKVIGE